MIHRLAHHLRSNAVAYVALFVALGGTSYAATSLPRGSVGTRQLRNGAVTPSKLSKTAVGGIEAVTVLNAGGVVLPSLSTPKNIRTVQWTQMPGGQIEGIISYPHRFPKTCTPLTTSSPAGLNDPQQPPTISAAPVGLSGFSKVQILDNNISGITVIIVCPR